MSQVLGRKEPMPVSLDHKDVQIARLRSENTVLRLVAEAADILLHSDVIGSNSFNIETLAGAVRDWKNSVQDRQEPE